MSDLFCPRQIIFTIPGKVGVQVTATENDGKIDFIVDALGADDLRGLFFHFNELKLAGLQLTGGDGWITGTQVKANGVINLDQGVNMNGHAAPFDFGIKFGTPGKGKDLLDDPIHFTLSNAANDLTLDDFAHLQFGARLTSSGDKIVTIAPAAPDAVADEFKTNIFEDGAAGLNNPSKAPTAIVLDVLKNDTDADGLDQLIITAFHDGPSHGTVAIGPDGKTVLYTPDLDYSGPDSFEYCVSDGNGGQDHALVKLELAAVADLPTIDVEVISSASVYEFTLKVTTKENDADSSEFIDRIDAAVAGGLPAGVNIAPLGGINPGDEPNEIVQEFKVTLPQNQDIDFDLNFTAVSEETSNGDQEVASKAIAIELDFNHNFFNASFFADNQNLWGPGPAFSFHEQEFIGLDPDEPFDPPQIDIPIPPTPILLFGDAAVDPKVGFDFEISITGGEFDATIPFDVTLDTTYNKTTDRLLIDPTFAISAAGATIDGTGPGGFLRIQPIFDVKFDLEVGIDLIVTELGLVSIHQPVNPTLPGLTLDTGDAATTIPLSPGFSLGLDFPELNPDAGPSTANPLVAHTSSDNFVQINLDVDAFAANFFPLLAALSVPIPFGATIGVASVIGSLLPFDADVTGGLNLVQDLSMQVVGLMGTLTFEDGSKIENFNFGAPLPPIEQASTKDLNGNDKIDFTLAIMPIVNITNNTDININIGLSLELLSVTGVFSTLVEDFPFDEAVVDFEEQFDIASFPVFHSPAFNLPFASQDFMLAA